MFSIVAVPGSNNAPSLPSGPGPGPRLPLRRPGAGHDPYPRGRPAGYGHGRVATFKWPERLEIIAELPATKVGKIDKKALREDIARRLMAV